MESNNQNNEMPFLHHVMELRKRLIVSIVALVIATIFGFFYYDSYVSTLIQPFGERLYISQIEQGFTTKIRVSLYIGLIISFPIHLYNIIAFILPALTSGERRVLLSFLVGSFILLIGGAVWAYSQVLPMSIQFLKGTSFYPSNVDIWLDYKSSLSFVFQLLLSFLVLFQVPLILLLLLKMGIVKRSWLQRSIRYLIILVFVISAILTPPDIISQLALSIPLIFLLFLTMVFAKVFNLGDSKD